MIASLFAGEIEAWEANKADKLDTLLVFLLDDDDDDDVWVWCVKLLWGDDNVDNGDDVSEMRCLSRQWREPAVELLGVTSHELDAEAEEAVRADKEVWFCTIG